jgi:predicted exporter
MIVILLGSLLCRGLPGSDFSASTFRPRVSASQSALDHLDSRLHDDPGMLSLVVAGKNSAEVLSRLQSIQPKLELARKNGRIKSFFSPLALWPDANRQRQNIAALAPLEGELPRLQKAVQASGFTEDAFDFTASLFRHIGLWKASPLPIWPNNETSRWVLRRLARHADGTQLALGVVEPQPGHEEELVKSLEGEGIYLVSWGSLGDELKKSMPGEILRVAAALFAGIILILSFGLRSIRSVILFVITTVLVLSCLAGAMSLFGMKLGFFNLAALLLLLGTGTDYSILLLLGLRRHRGDIAATRRELSVVIFLCCTSAAAGFGSLAWANNMGLANLGKTCALGLLIDGMISLFLLPRAWGLLFPEKKLAKEIIFQGEAP